MPKRLLICFTLLFFPLSALADDSDPIMSPLGSTETTQTKPGAGETSDSGLGPQKNTNSAGGSNADGGALQPAGLSPLQSTTGASNGLAAPTTNALQAPADKDYALQVLSGEADGAPIYPAGSNERPEIPWLIILFAAMLLTAAAVVIRDRRRFRDPHATPRKKTRSKSKSVAKAD